MIYVLQVDNHRWVKVGYTGHDDVAKRIAQLQTGNPYPITAVMTVEGTLAEEQALHAALREALLRMHLTPAMNEWYPGRHHFMKGVMYELKHGPRAATAFADGYAHDKVGLRNGDLVLPRKERDELRRQRSQSSRAGHQGSERLAPAARCPKGAAFKAAAKQ
jgi:hypothetical protein